MKEMNINNNIKIIHDIKEFVCLSLKDRDDHHGFLHALEVFNNATKKYIERHSLNSLKDLNYGILAAVALLHDVCDHKFSNNIAIKENMNKLLTKLFAGHYDLILHIIDDISYSKENKRLIEQGLEPDSEEANNYFEFKYGKEFAEIRNIISDEDKKFSVGINWIEEMC